LTCAPFQDLASNVTAKLTAVQNALKTALDAASQIPLLHQQLGDLDKSQVLASNVLAAFQNGLNAGTTDAAVQNALFTVLGPGTVSNPGLNILGDTNNDGSVNAADIVITHAGGDCTASLELLLHKSLAMATVPFGFDLGLPGIPLKVSSTGGVQISVGFDYELAFGIDSTQPTPVFSVDTTKLLTDFGKPLPPYQLSLHAVASVVNHSQLTAALGFIRGILTDNGGTSINVSFNVNNLGINTTPQVALDGVANANLHMAANFGPQFPSIGTDLVLHWGFGSQNAAPTVQFNNVSIQLGSLFRDVIGPRVQDIAKAVKPIQPALDILTAPIPVLSDIAGHPITLLTIVSGSFGSGGPADVTALAQVIHTLGQLSNDIAALSTAPSTLSINLGSFDLGGANGDLRNLPPAASTLDSTWQSNPILPNLTNLLVNAPSLRDVVSQISDPTLSHAAQDFKTQTDADVDLSFPFLKDPANSVFKLLLGQDAPLVSFSARFSFSARTSQTYPLPILPIIQVGYQGSLNIDAAAKISYDTFGIREFLRDNNTDKLLDGFYLAADPSDPNSTHVTITGSLHAVAQASARVFSVGVTGGPDASITISLRDPADNDGKLRYDELRLTPCLFDVHGQLDASLTAFVKIGVDTPLGFVGYQKDFKLASVRLANFNLSCSPNPFKLPVLTLAHKDDPSDPTRLILNMGSLANRQALTSDPDFQNNKNANFVVTHVSGDQNGETLNVSAFGITQPYTGIKTIVVSSTDGSNGDDMVTIGQGVFSSLDVHEGNGNNFITYQGSGNATITAGNGNNVLVGGTGVNTFQFQGNGNNKLSGPGVDNFQVTGDGNNELTGGVGPNYLAVSGNGSNKLYAGTGNDTLVAIHGVDTLFAGRGNDTITVSDGRSFINWQAGDGNLSITADGGFNELQVQGSDNPDTFVLNPYQTRGVSVLVNNNRTITANAFMQIVAIDGAGGADSTIVNDLGANTQVQEVDVNAGEAQAPDGAADVTTINGAPDYHNILVTTDSVWLHSHGRDDPQDGGVMKVQTRPQYQVHVAVTNNEDDLFVNAKGSNNIIHVRSNTGHTVINTDAGSDTFDLFSTDLATPGQIYYVPPPPADPSLLFGMRGLLELHAGAGANTLIANAGASPDPITLTLTDATLAGSVAHAGQNLPFQVQYSATGNFNGGITIRTGAAANVINVQSTPNGAPTLILSSGGPDHIFVGDANNTLNSIRGPLTVNGNNGPGTTVTFNDQGLATAGSYFITFALGNILSRNGQSFVFLNIGDMVLNAGNHNNTIDVRTFVGAAVTLNGGNGTNTLIVGDSGGGNQLSFTTSLTINGQSGQNSLTINDQGSNLGFARYLLTATSLERSFVGIIKYNNIQTFALNAGSGNPHFMTILGTAGGTTYTVKAGANVDMIALGGTVTSLSQLQGNLNIDGQGGALFVFDGPPNGNQTYVIAATRLKRGSSTTANYTNIRSLLFASGGGNTIDVESSAAGVPIIVNGAAAPDTINIGTPGPSDPVGIIAAPVTVNAGTGPATISLGSGGSNSTLDNIQAAVTVNDGTGTSTVIVDDSGFVGDETYTIKGTTVDVARLLNPLLSYSGIGHLVVTGGQSTVVQDIFNIDSNSADTTVNGSLGLLNCFRVSPFSQYLAGNIRGLLTVNGAGADVIDFIDSMGPGGEMYLFDVGPTSLALGSLGGTVISNFSGMATVAVETDGGGAAAVTDPNGTVLIDMGSPCGPASEPRISQLDLARALVDSAQTRSALPIGAHLPDAMVMDRARHATRKAPGDLRELLLASLAD
jgi:Ca2+-binding RTX toxin-like protein